MKKAVAIFCLLLLCAGCGSQTSLEPVIPPGSSTETRLAQYISDLSGDDMSGRQAGTAGEAQAGLYLARFMQKAGLLPQGEKATYFQSFPLAAYQPVLVDGRMTFRQSGELKAAFSENILGLKPGKSKEIIIISAHYDHLGIIEKKLYPGANDNASGVAAVMELMTALVEENTHYSLLFAFWGAEEKGLLGSEYFCANPTIFLENVRYVLNLDSIGTLTANKKLLGWGKNIDTPDASITEALQQEGWTIAWEESSRNNSDQASFAKRNIEAITLLSPGWLEKNHTPLDNAKTINTKILAELLLAIEKALLT